MKKSPFKVHMNKDSLNEKSIGLPPECHLPETKSQLSSSSILLQMITAPFYLVNNADHFSCYVFSFFPEKLLSESTLCLFSMIGCKHRQGRTEGTRSAQAYRMSLYIASPSVLPTTDSLG